MLLKTMLGKDGHTCQVLGVAGGGRALFGSVIIFAVGAVTRT